MWSTDGGGAGAGGTGGNDGLLTQMERCRSDRAGRLLVFCNYFVGLRVNLMEESLQSFSVL
jgi:hypothetical protein